MKEELERMSREIKRIKIKRIPTTFLGMINRSFDETTISKCIAYLINPEYTSLKIIEQLLNISSNSNDEADFKELFASEQFEYQSIDIEEQISSRSRLDILIRFTNFWLVIENKINSAENNDQSDKYEIDVKKKTNLPVKYICLKPKYNKTNLKNPKFSTITYNDLIEALKTITKYDLADEENMLYIDDFIKHAEVFFMNDNEIQINEEVEFYVEHKSKIEDIIKTYKKQCELVRSKLEQDVKNKFGIEYDVYCSKNGFLQIWNKKWDNAGHMGIHYEILCDFGHIIGYETKVEFAVHNERGTKSRYPEVQHRQEECITYDFSDSKKIEESIKNIVDKIYLIAKQNDSQIDRLFK